MRGPCFCWLMILTAVSLRAHEENSERRVIEPALLHLRSGVEREWSEFPETAHGQRLDVTFASKRNPTEQTIFVRQQDVKQDWNILLNGRKLGELVRDENDMVVTFAISAGILVDGDNSLLIESPSANTATSDDIRVGEVVLLDRSIRDALREATLDVEVIDADSKQPLPCRITVLNAEGAMQSLGAESDDILAVRPGMAFTSTGLTALGVPAGQYTIFAGRGFEYSLARADVTVSPGDTAKQTLVIQREVPTEGYVACDTHVHTLTHSGHGDATIDERMITLAGEGIELPIATDHNTHIDYEETAAKMGVRQYFTPVIGNEVTTARGHFNIFPIDAGARVVDHKQTDWGLLFDDIQQTSGVKVAILNHARDLHSGVRPLGPKHFNALVGENLDGWPLRFNAMEIINSGATQSDALRLFHDWMGLLNRGLNVTPVGSSDSHDVGRHFVGQGRTYIRCDDRDPGKLNVDEAVTSFLEGHVMVSYGLLTELIVNNRFHSGDLAIGLGSDEVRIDVRVLGPHWTRASQVRLFANGHVLRETEVSESPDTKLPIGVKWHGSWAIPKPRHDVHLVAIATGPGIDGLYWRTAKPYQSVSRDWEARTIGCSGAVWLDIDNDGRRTSARDYAERLVTATGNDWAKLVASLSTFDEAVAAQTAYLVQAAGTQLQTESLLEALRTGTPATRSGFRTFAESRRENEIARATP